ncbi:hypothetical protein F0237_23310 [Vibrio tubiashii]|uniref:Uncharacterized protein n=1 Tax=Vibrio tubiashii TaxID=29498 RepID=A0AAE5LK90_9VIBR|nr:hypothetical protein [Vibrio tubiashii]
MLTDSLLYLGRVLQHPAVQRGVVHTQATFLEYLLDISVTELVRDIIANRLKDKCAWVLLTGEIKCHGKDRS